MSWSHPNNFTKKNALQYALQYGIGAKFNGQEQFRQIYKGKAHKCIITDLMPKTTYRFRVAPILLNDDGSVIEGEWSDINNIATKEN